MLQAPLCGAFCPHSVAVARYATFIRTKSPTNGTRSLRKAFFRHALALCITAYCHMSRLTTVTVKSEKEIKKLVQCYAHRWKIEQFHFILKSGCKIEKNQAREYGRLSFLTLLYSVIAMQILNLTYLGKICPEISSGIVFAEEEWKVLCCCARKSKEIPEAYSLKEAIYDLGVLGGTKGAPSDGMPGVRSIWQGLDVLYSLLAYRNYLV